MNDDDELDKKFFDVLFNELVVDLRSNITIDAKTCS